jgi:hypothetical protein
MENKSRKSFNYEELVPDPFNLDPMMPEISLKCPVIIRPTEKPEGYVITDVCGNEFFFRYNKKSKKYNIV